VRLLSHFFEHLPKLGPLVRSSGFDYELDEYILDPVTMGSAPVTTTAVPLLLVQWQEVAVVLIYTISHGVGSFCNSQEGWCSV